MKHEEKDTRKCRRRNLGEKRMTRKNIGIRGKIRIKLDRHTSYQRKRRIGGKSEKIKGFRR